MSDRPSCYNRPDFMPGFLAPDGFINGHRKASWVPHRMSTTCKQWGPLGEAKKYNWNCTGCRHKPTEDKCTICGGNGGNATYEGNTDCGFPGREGCLRVQRLKEETT